MLNKIKNIPSMKFHLILLFLFSTQLVFSQFYPVNDTTITVITNNKSSRNEKVQSFVISNLITVKEFKIYLESVKSDSTDRFYKSQLPSSSKITNDLVNMIFSDSALQNKPMPGVSWTVALNYCKWLNRSVSSLNIGYEYELPLLSEMIAFTNLYGLDNLSELESWTLNTYDESMLGFRNTINYSYYARTDDPPSLKRKVIYGASYHMNYKLGTPYRTFQYEYQDSSSRFIGFRIIKRLKNIHKDTLSINDQDISFGIINNHLEGVYCEKYTSGKIKVLGSFSDGQRVGIWSIWDENGILQVRRMYTNNKICDFLFPITVKTYNEIFKQFPESSLNKNSKSFIPYTFVEEREVVYSQRVWRQLSSINEPELFKQVDFRMLVEHVFDKNSKIFLYEPLGSLRHEIPQDSMEILKSQFSTWDFNRIEIKEDFFFNLNSLLSDTRQISIGFYKDSNAKTPSYSIYYPWLREVLSTIKLKNSNMKEVENLDDLFFYHNYRGNIVWSRNDFEFENGTEENKLPNEFKIELEKFVEEHKLWLAYGR